MHVRAPAARYSPDPAADRAALDRAYAQAMDELSRRYPDDLEAATLYAESLMDLRPWHLWNKDGTPAGEYESLISKRCFMPVFRHLLLLGLLFASVPHPPGLAASPQPGDRPALSSRATVIKGALVLDGTGSPGRRTNVRIEGDLIVQVGRAAPAPGDAVVDGAGLALAPGFIDTHSHGDGQIFDRGDALAATSQGITTLVVGQDGGSYLPLARFFRRLERRPAAVNVASYAGHGTIRARVMGDDFRRHATPAEIAKMKRLLDREMRAGAIGLSSGLEYDPGIYSA
ncbi:MAG: amidohydrolase family protein, partial [Acidobacteria bacterium]|nr:amidohydrolase family protein [Acidobacteriota bacterium]